MGLGSIVRKAKRAVLGKKGKGKAPRRDATLAEHANRPQVQAGRGRRDAVLGQIGRQGEAREQGHAPEPIALHGWKGGAKDGPQGRSMIGQQRGTKAPSPETPEAQLPETQAPDRSANEPEQTNAPDQRPEQPEVSAYQRQPVSELSAYQRVDFKDPNEDSSSQSSVQASEKSGPKQGAKQADDSESDSSSSSGSLSTTTSSSDSQAESSALKDTRQSQKFKQGPVKEGAAEDENLYRADLNVSESGSEVSSSASSTVSSTASDSSSAVQSEKETKRKTLYLPPEVQKATRAHRDFEIAKLQSDLRTRNDDKGKETYQQHGETKDVNRAEKSDNEVKSAGWATTSILDRYRTKVGAWSGAQLERGEDGGKGELHSISGQATKYFLSKLMALSADAQSLLSTNLKAGKDTAREDTVLRLQDGKFYFADGKLADTTEVEITNQTINNLKETWTKRIEDPSTANEKITKLQAKLDRLRDLDLAQHKQDKEGTKTAKEAAKLGGRFIFVMNAAGQFFAGKSEVGVVHHSSFLAGGAVACAGEVEIQGGVLKTISNASGHYMPGPAYVWQALKQMQGAGIPLDNVKVEITGISKPFPSAAKFLTLFDPSTFLKTDEGLLGSWFNLQLSVKRLNEMQAGHIQEDKAERKAAQTGVGNAPQGGAR